MGRADTRSETRSAASAASEKRDLKLAMDCVEILQQATRVIRMRLRKARSGKRQLTLPQFRALMRMRRGPCTNKQLASDIGLSFATTSRIIQQLSLAGFITRQTDTKDRREVWLNLSAAGATHIHRAHEETSRDLAKKLKDLDNNGKKSLKDGLKIIFETMCELPRSE